MVRLDDLLILASWGDPYSWREARYVVRGPGGEVLAEVTSETSLAALMKYAEARGFRPHALIIVQETLLAAPTARKVGGEIRRMKRDYLPIAEIRRVRGDLNAAYRALVRGLGDGIRRWVGEHVLKRLEEYGVSAGEGCVDVAVAPGVGAFQYRGVDGSALKAVWELLPRRSNPFSFYASVAFTHVLRRMLQLHSGGRLRLAVDLTHGVNYTSTAAYRAALAAARVYAVSTGREVLVEVYNSEPFIEGEELRVWLIREGRVVPRAAASRLVYLTIGGRGFPPRLINALLSGDGRILRELNQQTPTPCREASVKAAAAVIVGAPLLLLQAGLEAGCEGYSHDNLVKILAWLEGSIPRVEVLREDGRVRVRHLLTLDFSSLKAYVAAYALNLYAANAYEELRKALGGEVGSEGGCGALRVCASVEALDKAINYLAGPSHYVVQQEVSELKNALDKSKKGQDKCEELKADLYRRVCLAALHRRDYPASPAAGGVDRRIFVAHAGLNSDIVDVIYRGSGDGGGKVLLTYSPSKLGGLEHVAKDVLNALRIDIKP